MSREAWIVFDRHSAWVAREIVLLRKNENERKQEQPCAKSAHVYHQDIDLHTKYTQSIMGATERRPARATAVSCGVAGRVMEAWPWRSGKARDHSRLHAA